MMFYFDLILSEQNQGKTMNEICREQESASRHFTNGRVNMAVWMFINSPKLRSRRRNSRSKKIVEELTLVNVVMKDVIAKKVFRYL